jgi:hypothetical protein
MIDLDRFFASAWCFLGITFISACYGMFFGHLVWDVLIESVTFDQFVARLRSTISSSISLASARMTAQLSTEFLQFLMPSTKSSINSLLTTILFAVICSVTWPIQSEILSLFHIGKSFHVHKLLSYIVIQTLSRFSTLIARNLLSILHPSSAVGILTHRQIKLHIPYSLGRAIKMIAIGVRDRIPVNDCIASSIGTTHSYVGGMIRWSVSDEYLRIMQERMRSAFGL